MKVNIKKEETKEIQLEFQTGDLTIPDLLANVLLSNDDVEFAGVSKDHPETGKPVLVIKSKKSAKSDLSKALKEVDETFDELKSQLGSSRKRK